MQKARRYKDAKLNLAVEELNKYDSYDVLIAAHVYICIEVRYEE